MSPGPTRAASPASPRLKIVILGLSITSSWGNGHATTYRGLVRELARRGHDVLFLERDVPWYAENRDLAQPPFGRTALYGDLDELRRRHGGEVGAADLVIVGSYVPDGIAVGDWVQRQASGLTAFYDIDTPVTLARLGARRARLPRAAADRRLRPVPLVHRRADAATARARVRRAAARVRSTARSIRRSITRSRRP